MLSSRFNKSERKLYYADKLAQLGIQYEVNSMAKFLLCFCQWIKPVFQHTEQDLFEVWLGWRSSVEKDGKLADAESLAVLLRLCDFKGYHLLAIKLAVTYFSVMKKSVSSIHAIFGAIDPDRRSAVYLRCFVLERKKASPKKVLAFLAMMPNQDSQQFLIRYVNNRFNSSHNCVWLLEHWLARQEISAEEVCNEQFAKLFIGMSYFYTASTLKIIEKKVASKAAGSGMMSLYLFVTAHLNKKHKLMFALRCIEKSMSPGFHVAEADVIAWWSEVVPRLVDLKECKDWVEVISRCRDKGWNQFTVELAISLFKRIHYDRHFVRSLIKAVDEGRRDQLIFSCCKIYNLSFYHLKYLILLLPPEGRTNVVCHYLINATHAIPRVDLLRSEFLEELGIGASSQALSRVLVASGGAKSSFIEFVSLLPEQSRLAFVLDHLDTENKQTTRSVCGALLKHEREFLLARCKIMELLVRYRQTYLTLHDKRVMHLIEKVREARTPVELLSFIKANSEQAAEVYNLPQHAQYNGRAPTNLLFSIGFNKLMRICEAEVSPLIDTSSDMVNDWCVINVRWH